MSRRMSSRDTLWTLAVLALILAVWGQLHAPSAASSPPPVESRTIALQPNSLPVNSGGLRGRLEDLRVTERVERKTGKIFGGLELKGTLQLTNASSDLAIRPLGGSVEYADANGAAIGLAKDQGNTDFTIFMERSTGLKPGEHTSQAIDVPFPADALEAHRLQDIRLHLTYLSTPYAKITVDGPVLLGQ
jgi:hypothetical protein